MARIIDMTKGKPTKLLISFALPILIGNLFQQIYSLADRIIVGQYVGSTAFSAIGAKDEKNTAKAIVNGLYTTIAITIVTTIIALFLTNPMLRLLNTPSQLMEDAEVYMKIYLSGLIAISFYYAPFSVLRALGDAKTPLIFLLICSVLNIVLDLIFVVPLGMGVKGAAIATVLAQVFSAGMCLFYSIKKVPQFKTAMKYMKPDFEITKQVLKVGIPSGIQYSLIYISSIVLQRVVNGYGETVIGAFTATTQVEMLLEQIFAALATAMLIYTGQNIGAGKIDRIKMGLISAIKICVGTSLGITILMWCFGKIFMSMFVSDAEIIAMAATGIRITSLFFVAFGTTQIFCYILNGTGDAVFSMINGGVEIIARVSFAIALTTIPFIGVRGIWLTTGFTWISTAIIAILRYASGVWKSKSVIR